MSAFIDLTGRKSERLTVLRKSHAIKGRGWYWICECECSPGVETRPLQGSRINTGELKSCGCLRLEEAVKSRWQHGMTGTPVYRSWHGAKRRGEDKSDPDYGGRGITMCERWRASFVAFYADMGDKPEGREEIERKNNDAGYWCGKEECPECGPLKREPNCKWANPAEQNRNKRNSRPYTVDGITKTLGEWASEYSMGWECLNYRLFGMGLTFQEAVSRPVASREMKHFYKGEWKTYAELSEVSGVKPKQIAHRINDQGWTLEEAVETPPRECRHGMTFEWEGRQWNLKELAQKLGKPYRVVYNQLFCQKWTLDKVVSTPYKTKSRRNKVE